MVLVGVVRLGQVHLRPRSTSRRRRCSPATSAAAWSPTTRTTSRRRRDAFDVLHYVAGKRLRRRPADRGRRDQRAAARRAGQLVAAGPRARRAAGRDRARRAGGGVPGAQRRPRRTATSARGVIRRQRDELRRGAARAGAGRASARCTCCAAPRRSRPPTITLRAAATTTGGTSTGPFDVIGDVHGCRAELEELLGRARLRAASATSAGRAGRRRATRTGARAVFVGDLVDRGPDSPGVLRLVMGMVAAGHALVRAGQPRGQAGARAARAQRAGHATAWPRRWPSWPARPTEFRTRGRGRSATAWSATTCSTAGGWWSRTPGSRRRYHGRASRPGAQLRAVRRHHRRDRRVRPAGALPVGEGLPRPGDGALRAHPDAGAGVGQQHHVPRHRVRVRRAADRAALPRAGARVASPAAAGLLRAGAAVPGRRRAAPRRGARRRRARPRRRARQAGRRDRPRTAGSPCARRTRRRRSR